MKQNAGPVAIGVAVVGVIVLLVFLYRYFFPPLPPADTDNPKNMPGYAKQAMEYLKTHPDGAPPPSGMPGAPMPQAPGSSGAGK